jgi:hypothetical protein
MAFEFFRFFLVLLVPGIIGATVFSLAARGRIEINLIVALILDLLTFITMLIGLYYGKQVYNTDSLQHEFTCLHFTSIYTLMTIGINIFYGVVIGFFRRLFPANR